MSYIKVIFILASFAVTHANVPHNSLKDYHKDVQSLNGDHLTEHKPNDEVEDQRILVGADNQLERVVPMEMASLGRVADMGELYDGRTDKFLGISIFNKKITSESIVSTQNKETKLLFSYANSLEEKFNILDISASIKIGIMSGLVDIEGSARFFKDQKTSWRSAKATMINSFSTVYETVSVTSVNKQVVDFDVLSKIDATHVVVGIQWGGQIFISVEDRNEEDKDRIGVEGSLKIEIKKIPYVQISGSGSIKIEQYYRTLYDKYSFELYGDIVPDETPQSLIDAVKFMKDAPKLLQQGNNGKGKAIRYVLIPISILRSLWATQAKANALVNSICKETIKRCVAFYDEMNVIEQKLNDLHSDVLKWDPYIRTSVINEIKELRHNFHYHQARVRKDLAEALMQVRSGNKSVSTLENVIMNAMRDDYSYNNTELKMKKFDFILQEMAFLKMVKLLNVTLLSKYSVLQLFLWEKFNKDIFILFYNYHDNEGTDFSVNFNVTNTFRRMLGYKNYSSAIFAAVNNDVLYTKKNLQFFQQIETTPKISYFRNGKLLLADFNYVFNKSHDDPEMWPNAYIQMQLEELLKYGRFPIGYILTQLPYQKDPNKEWETNWNDVTDQIHQSIGLRCTMDNRTKPEFMDGDNKIVGDENNNPLRLWKRIG